MTPEERIAKLEAENEALRKMGLELLSEWKDAAIADATEHGGDGYDIEAQYARRRIEWGVPEEVVKEEERQRIAEREARAAREWKSMSPAERDLLQSLVKSEIQQIANHQAIAKLLRSKGIKFNAGDSGE